jgi:tetratricopeptide (TPR) repeat protein
MRSRRLVAAAGALLLLIAAGAVALLYANRREVTTSSGEAARAYREALDNERCFYVKEARLGYARALALDPAFAEAMLGLSRVISDDDQAKTLVRRAVREKGRLSERERFHVEMELARVEKRRDDVLKIAAQTRSRYPDDARAAMMLCSAEIAKGNREAAVRILTEVLEKDPNNPDAYNQIGYYYAFKGDTERALEYLKKYQFMLPSSANPYDSLGEVLGNAGRYDEAIANLQKGLQLKPDFFESFRHLGLVYEGKGDAAKAIDAYRKAAELADSDGKRADMLTSALRAAMVFKNRPAAEEAAAALARVPKGPYTEIGKEVIPIALDLTAGRPADAERRLTEVKPKWEALVSREPMPQGWKSDWPAWNMLMARAKLAQGKDAEALPLLETLANPPNPWRDFEGRRWVYEGRAHLAALLARRGNLDRAEKLLEENRKWNPSWAPTRDAELVVAQLRREKVLAATK